MKSLSTVYAIVCSVLILVTQVPLSAMPLQNPVPPPMPPQNLITDSNFQAGVRVLDPRPPNEEDPTRGAYQGDIQYPGASGPAIWTLKQWNSQQSIWGTSAQQLTSDSWKWANAFKYFVMGTPDSANGNFIFNVNSRAEYNNLFRQSSSVPWPHLLVSQNFHPVNPVTVHNLSQMTELNFNIDALLQQADNNQTIPDSQGHSYNSRLHVAHFLIYFIAKNTTSNKFLWFGIELYNDGVPFPGLKTKDGDTGTGNPIYGVGIQPFTTSGMTVGIWKNIKGDLLPLIKNGIDWAFGHGFLPDQNYANYQVDYMNMGWEVTGLSNVTMQIKNLSADVFGYYAPRGYEWSTNGDREGWTPRNLTETRNGPLNGTWVFTATSGSDPQLVGPTNFHLNAATFKKVKIRAANAASVAQNLRVYWKHNGEASFSQSQSRAVTIPAGGGWRELVVDMTGIPSWSGDITQLRIDVVDQGTGSAFGVDYVHYE